MLLQILSIISLPIFFLFLITCELYRKHLIAKYIKPRLIIEKRLKERSIIHDTTMTLMLFILKDRLYEGCKFYIEKGEISLMELKELSIMYDSYTNLGGNGTCKELYERVTDLKII